MSSGIASGTTAMLALAPASSSSSGVALVRLVCAFSMFSAIMIMMIPPPTCNEPTENPKKPMICSPSKADRPITIATEIDATLMVRRFSSSVWLSVRLMKNGIAPIGLISASSEKKLLVRSMGSVAGALCQEQESETLGQADAVDQSVPLVDGIVPAARGSSSTAMRSARPKALNTVSIW